MSGVKQSVGAVDEAAIYIDDFETASKKASKIDFNYEKITGSFDYGSEKIRWRYRMRIYVLDGEVKSTESSSSKELLLDQYIGSHEDNTIFIYTHKVNEKIKSRDEDGKIKEGAFSIPFY